MNSSPFAHLLVAALAFAAFSSTACARNEQPARPAPSEPPAASAPAPPSTPPTAPPAPAAPEFSTAQWIDIREYSYAQRDTFFSGLKAVEARVDAQIAVLGAKRASMDPATDTRDWDLAMQQMVIARAQLKASGEELRKAKPQTWRTLKDKVGEAWVQTQNAFAKVKSSTTV